MDTVKEIRCKGWDNGAVAESMAEWDCEEGGEIAEEGKVGLGWAG